MLPTLLSVDLARSQFAFVVLFHFLFVPLTLGLTWIVFTMEVMYVKTGKQVYKDMVKFWGKLLGINFAIGVLTGLTMEFEFGSSWAYYSQYVGDIFGTPLAIEGLVAFMLESTFFGIFFFGWDKLSKKQHLTATFCLAIGSNLSALLILVANGFMQVPVGGSFVWQTVRMQTSNLGDMFLSSIAQNGFAHTVIAGYVTSAVFVVGISAFYLLKGRDIAFAKRSLAIALGFGLIASILLMFMGDNLGRDAYKDQPLKLAAIEAEWGTQQPPAAFNIVAFPDQEQQKNYGTIQLPGLLGPIVTHSFGTKIYGIKTILYDGYTNTEGKKVASVVDRIKSGAIAYDAMMLMRKHLNDKTTVSAAALAKAKQEYNAHKNDLGYGMLLVRPMGPGKLLSTATSEQIREVATNSVPDVTSIFWTFRIMVGLGILMFLMFLVGLLFVIRNTAWKKRWMLRWMVYMIPAPFIACLCGWWVTEHGRQPWSVYGVLPTTLSASTINQWDVLATLIIFIVFDLSLFAVELFLMFKFARLGPSSLHTGRYHFEKKNTNNLDVKAEV